MKRRYYTSFVASEDEDEKIEIKRENPFYRDRLLKMDFIPVQELDEFKGPNKQVKASEQTDEDFEEFKLNKQEMKQKEAQLMDQNREFNKKLDSDPDNPMLWVEYLKFQDKYHKGLVGKANSSVREGACGVQ